MIILRIYRQTGIWLIISLLLCSLSLKKDGFLYAEMIRSKGKFIIAQNNDVIVQSGNREIWSLTNIAVNDITSYGNDLMILSGNSILIYSLDGRKKGVIELNEIYSKMERVSGAYYLYSEIRGELVLFMHDSGLYTRITDMSGVISIERDMNDNIMVLNNEGLYRIARNGSIIELLSTDCSSFSYDQNNIYIHKNEYIYNYYDDTLRVIKRYPQYKPFIVQNGILYYMENNAIDSMRVK